MPTYTSVHVHAYIHTYVRMYVRAYIHTYACELYVYIYIDIRLSVSIYLSTCLSIYPSIYLSICLSGYPSIYPSTHPPIYLSIYLSMYLCIYYLCVSMCEHALIVIVPFDNDPNPARVVRCWLPFRDCRLILSGYNMSCRLTNLFVQSAFLRFYAAICAFLSLASAPLFCSAAFRRELLENLSSKT